MAHHPDLPRLLDRAPLQVDGDLIDHWLEHDTMLTARHLGAVHTGARAREFRWDAPTGHRLVYRRNLPAGDFHLADIT